METQEETGVSATHLDWTMVPYVRKSFYKHYLDGLKYIEKQEEIKPPIEADKGSSCSIEDTDIYSYEGAYSYAMDMTVKELQQAVEGMYHNLKRIRAT